jgi:predicted DCC family thiol-disulfide oxidoreductase YuxK
MIPIPEPIRSGPVLLYDGTCGLCNRAVRLLLRIDRRGRLRFAPLQGPGGQAWLAAHGMATRDFGTLVFVRDWEAGQARPGDHLVRTDGLVAALRECGGLGTVLAWVRFVPRPWRDAAYGLIARTRYRVFGGWRPRPLARPELGARFIGGYGA